MSDPLLVSVQESIAKHLPAATAGELKKYIEQAERDKDTITGLKEDVKKDKEIIANKDKLITEQRTKIDKFNEMGRTEEALNLREIALDKRDREFELELLRAQVDHERQTKEQVRDVVRDVFHSPVYSKNIVKDTPILTTQYDYEGRPNGQTVQSQYSNETETITKS